MFSSAMKIATAAAFASAAFAAPTARQENCDPAEQPFNLTVTSVNGDQYVADFLWAPHTGAGAEVLATYPNGEYGGANFTFNQTPASVPTGYCGVGYLQYAPAYDPASDEPQQLQFMQNSTSNVAVGFFGEGTTGSILVAFSNESEMFYYDGDQTYDNYWFVCPETTLGYSYNALSHVANGAVPTNPECDQVTVQMSY